MQRSCASAIALVGATAGVLPDTRGDTVPSSSAQSSATAVPGQSPQQSTNALQIPAVLSAQYPMERRAPNSEAPCWTQVRS